LALDVYLRGKQVGSLRPAGGGYEFAYAEEALVAAGDGDGHSPARLSRSLSLRAEPFAYEEVRAYVEGLLPAGARRERIAAELGLDPADGYGLIAALGSDCPGAVVFLPEGAPPPRRPAREEIAWLEPRELEEVVATPPPRLFDPDRPQRMRFALPGERHKLALVLDGERGWAWPEPGLPSTHILVPEPGERPGFALNEAGCLLALRTIGLPVINLDYAPAGEGGARG
jgi:serine/threonine-protein kinase HipA